MTDFSVARSIGLMRRTAPFIMFRLVVYFGIAAAYVVVTGTGAGIGWGIGAFGTDDFRAGATAWGGIIGFGATAAAIYLLREYILYIVKAGHIAVMVEYLNGREVPEGHGQIAHARGVVKQRFGQASALFALDQIVKGVLRAVLGLVQGIATLLPIPGLDGLMRLVRAFLRVAVGLLDEVILGHLIRSDATNPWAGARDALVLYGQNAKPMLINAAWIALISYALAFAVFLVMLAPAAAIVWMMPGNLSAGGFVFAVIFAWAVKAALIEPFAIACLLQAFIRVTDGQQPDPAWSAKLDDASGKFRELDARAAGRAGGTQLPDPRAAQA